MIPNSQPSGNMRANPRTIEIRRFMFGFQRRMGAPCRTWPLTSAWQCVGRRRVRTLGKKLSMPLLEEFPLCFSAFIPIEPIYPLALIALDKSVSVIVEVRIAKLCRQVDLVQRHQCRSGQVAKLRQETQKLPKSSPDHFVLDFREPGLPMVSFALDLPSNRCDLEVLYRPRRPLFSHKCLSKAVCFWPRPPRFSPEKRGHR